MTKNLQRGDVFPLGVIETLDLPDSPCLLVPCGDDGEFFPVQTSHVSFEHMEAYHKIIGEALFRYCNTTTESVPVFKWSLENTRKVEAYFDVEPLIDTMDPELNTLDGQFWVTPINRYRPQVWGDDITKFLGRYQYRVEQDKFQHDVTLIYVRDLNQTFRMVHYSTPRNYKTRWQNMTIYGGRGKFFKVKSYYSQNDNEEHTITVGPYSMGWGDGDPGWYKCDNPAAPNLEKELMRISDDYEEQVIMTVLKAIARRDDLWTYKQPQK